MSFRPTRYPCTDTEPHSEHDHTDGPDSYYYTCPGVESDPGTRLADTGSFFVRVPKEHQEES